ncbi:MAG: RnfABCDGE type electron transport complex subunit G, partial [Bacteroidales bacterium]
LGGVNEITTEPIKVAKLAKQENAIKLVAPEYDNNPIADQWKTTLPDGTEAIIFPAKKNGELVGAAVQAMTKNGFGGPITLMVGFDKDGNVHEYSVLSHTETPGLGSKMPTWFHEKGNIIGKNPGKNKLTVSKDGGEVDAITAATISSRAFLDAVANAYNAFTNSQDAASGATKKAEETSAETNEEGK